MHANQCSLVSSYVCKPYCKTCIHWQLWNSIKPAACSFNKKLSHVRTKDLLLILQLSQLFKVYLQLASSNLFHSELGVGQIMHVFQPGMQGPSFLCFQTNEKNLLQNWYAHTIFWKYIVLLYSVDWLEHTLLTLCSAVCTSVELTWYISSIPLETVLWYVCPTEALIIFVTLCIPDMQPQFDINPRRRISWKFVACWTSELMPASNQMAFLSISYLAPTKPDL